MACEQRAASKSPVVRREAEPRVCLPAAFHPVLRRWVQALVHGSPCSRWVKAAANITQDCVGPAERLANSVLRASRLWHAARLHHRFAYLLRSILCCAVRFRQRCMVRRAAAGPPEWLANSVLRASHLWCAARLDHGGDSALWTLPIHGCSSCLVD